MAVSHDHLAGPLAFVAGLGLRKADALRSNISSVLGRVVYTNAADYLRVCDNGSSEGAPQDPFDDSRVHPECHVQNDSAPKICRLPW